MKLVYVQILDKNKDVLSSKGSIKLKNSDKIEYSSFIKAYFTNKNLSLLSLVEVDRESVNKGNYVVNIFVEKNQVGSTSIYLK